jgi:hypothetical protein
MLKMNAALAPFVEFGCDVLGNKDNFRGTTNEFVLSGVRFGCDKRENCCAVRGSNGDPAATGLKPCIKGKLEAQLVQVEAQAPFLIPNDDAKTAAKVSALIASRGYFRAATLSAIPMNELSDAFEP